jgi:hypothetical protein
MSDGSWYYKLRNWLLYPVGAVSWRLFCWANGYPKNGHVCDWAQYKTLPCDLDFEAAGGYKGPLNLWEDK